MKHSHYLWRVPLVRCGDKSRSVGTFLCSVSSSASQMPSTSSPRLPDRCLELDSQRPQPHGNGASHRPLSPPHFSPDGLSFNRPIVTAGHVWFLGLSGRQFLSGSSNFFVDLLLPRPSYTYPSSHPLTQTSQQFCFSDWTPNWYRPSQVRVAGSSFK